MDMCSEHPQVNNMQEEYFLSLSPNVLNVSKLAKDIKGFQLVMHWSYMYYSPTSVALTLVMLEMKNSSSFGQYHTCWCPGSLCRQGINRNDIDKIG